MLEARTRRAAAFAALLLPLAEGFLPAHQPWRSAVLAPQRAHIPRAGDGSPDLRGYFSSLSEGSGGGALMSSNADVEAGSTVGGASAANGTVAAATVEGTLPDASGWEEEAGGSFPADTKAIKFEVLKLASRGGRGKLLSRWEKARMESLLEQLEARNPTPEPAYSSLLPGKWSLVYTPDDPTRSSPFFWAFRKALAGIKDPRDSSRDLSEAIFSVTDSLPFKEIGAAWQTISATSLKSEVQVVLGALPANFSFFPYAESLMTTTSSLATLDGSRLELTVQDTRVCDSTPQRMLPSLLPLDEWAFPVARVFEQLSPYANTVTVTLTYLDADLRIARDPEGRPFVYTRVL